LRALAPQRRQFGSRSLIGSICGEAVFWEIVLMWEPTLPGQANDLEGPAVYSDHP
jgi:hypothetical protein